MFTEEVEWDVFIYSSIYPSFCATSTSKYVNKYIYTYTYIFLIEDIPLCLNSKSKTKIFKITVKTKQQCINISILLWQHTSVLLGHLQASIQGYEVQCALILQGLLYFIILNCFCVKCLQ